jgi:hypothetical protein
MSHCLHFVVGCLLLIGCGERPKGEKRESDTITFSKDQHTIFLKMGQPHSKGYEDNINLGWDEIWTYPRLNDHGEVIFFSYQFKDGVLVGENKMEALSWPETEKQRRAIRKLYNLE